MKRLQPVPSALSSGNWCKNLQNICPKLRTTSQSNVFFRKPSKTGNGVFEQQYYEQTSSATGSRVFQFKLFHREEGARRAAGSSGVPKLKLKLSAATSEAATTSHSRVPKFKLFVFPAAAAQAANSAAVRLCEFKLSEQQAHESLHLPSPIARSSFPFSFPNLTVFGRKQSSSLPPPLSRKGGGRLSREENQGEEDARPCSPKSSHRPV